MDGDLFEYDDLVSIDDGVGSHLIQDAKLADSGPDIEGLIFGVA
jgi:hypothetical protein